MQIRVELQQDGENVSLTKVVAPTGASKELIVNALKAAITVVDQQFDRPYTGLGGEPGVAQTVAFKSTGLEPRRSANIGDAPAGSSRPPAG